MSANSTVSSTFNAKATMNFSFPSISAWNCGLLLVSTMFVRQRIIASGVYGIWNFSGSCIAKAAEPGRNPDTGNRSLKFNDFGSDTGLGG